MRLARLRNDLVGTVSHELKTPLSSMRLLVDTLLDDEQFDEKTVREYLELIARENSRLSRLIDNFLTFSRLERDRMTFDFQLHSPEEIVEALMDAREGRLRVDATEFSVHIDPDLPPVLCDRDSILTALLNLLENAHKYSPPPRHIEMMVRNVGNAVQFSVSDRGIGMSRSDARRAFERFYQVDQRLSREGGGCGLGLSIVASIVQAHGGHVSVTSELGQGSTFMFGLPLALQTAIKT
jgi:signal transduction histidine kinase